MTTPMFDRIIVVDWSAESRPTRGRDSIWIASWIASSIATRESGTCSAVNPATRSEAVDILDDALRTRPAARTLVGVDFSLGYPWGTMFELGGIGVPWRVMWSMLFDLVYDDDRNENNRFRVAAELNRRFTRSAGPFWGCPPSKRSEHLTSTKVSPYPLPEWRISENVLRQRGLRPFSGWQLFGAGSVGGQSITGIARLEMLGRRLEARGAELDVWPFTTGLARPDVTPGSTVVAEVWPSMIPIDPDPTDSMVRDQRQVTTLASALGRLDARGELGELFAPDVPDEAGDPVDAIVREEGWVLGAGTRFVSA